MVQWNFLKYQYDHALCTVEVYKSQDININISYMPHGCTYTFTFLLFS